MRYGSVCSGIEAASVAWHPLGWEAAWLAEIEPFPAALLKHHYPGVSNLGDMTQIAARVLSGEVEAPDVLVGGTPCQAFSVAGLRNSLDDDRGQLTISFIHLLDAIDTVRSAAGRPAAICVWENVPGVLSTKDNAFGCFLAGLSGEDDPLVPPGKRWADAGCVFGPKRTVAWRILDAQYFGLAQRRRRVFVVASARDGFDPTKVFLEREGVRRDTPPSRETRKDTTRWPADCAADGGDIAPTVTSKWAKLSGGPSGSISELGNSVFATGALAAEPGMKQTTYIALQDVRDVDKQQNGRGWNDDGLSYTVDTHATQEVAICIKGAALGRKPEEGPRYGEIVAFHGSQDPDVSGDVTHPLGRNQGQEVCVRIMRESGQGYWMEDCKAGTLRAEGENRPSRPSNVIIHQAMQVRRLTPRECERLQGFPFVAPCLSATNDPSRSPQSSEVTQQVNAVFQSTMQVRRLTSEECEALQGFPRSYTNIPWRGKPDSPDGPRYKALGNSMAVPVMRWIGERIQYVLNHAD